MQVRIALLGVLLFPSAQEDDGQKNTALLKLYPKLEDLVERADALAKQRRFSEALEIYAEAERNHANFLVSVDRHRLIGIGSFILDRIASWPKEGREAYRQRYDPIALEDLDRAKRNGDGAILDEIVEKYPLSSVVDDALALRANLAFDSGDFDGAARALERILGGESDLPVGVLAARLGLAYSRAGRRAELEALLRRAEREWPRATIRVDQAECFLVVWLTGVLERTRPVEGGGSRALEIPGWEMIGGSPSGTRLVESGTSLGSTAWRFSVPVPSFESDEDERWRRHPAATPSDQYRPLFPAVSEGIVYVHGEYFATALNLFGSSPAPLWTYRLPQPNGVLMFDDRVLHATTVHEGRVFVNLVTALGDSEDQLGYVRVKYPFPKRALFALDAYTGRLLWQIGGKHRTDTLEENATFATPPTPEGNRLYVGAVKQRLSTDPFEHYVLCLDAATGRILWSTFVASGFTEINLFGNSTRESFGTPVVVAGDRLYYGTNHGAFAALDKRTGRLQWVARYAQLPILPTRSIHVQKNALQWVNSPPVVSGNVAVYTPTDSRYLYGFEASTGRRLWRVEREPEMRLLYGAREDLLVVGGEELFFFDLGTGRCLGTFRPRSPGAGRGVLTPDSVFMPTRDGVATVRIDTRAEVDFRRWSTGRVGGNILVVDGAFVRSAADVVETYIDRRGADKSLEELLQRAPEDPLLLYRAGVRLAQSGRTSDALRFLEKAFARVAGSSRHDEERLARACRLRLFHLRFELGREALRGRATAEARDHLTRAVALAPDTPTRLESVFLLAETYEAIQAPERAIRELYAQLDQGEEVVAGARVATLVRARVDEIVRRWGREAFAGLEREAREELERARRAGTPESFLSVPRRYPNSLTAETALLEAAAVFERLGRGEDEAGTLREFLREYARSMQAPEAYARLVLALERRGQFATAAPLLRRMIRNFPEAQVRDGERLCSAKEFAERRLASEPYRRGETAVQGTPLQPPLKQVLAYVSRAHPDVSPVRILGAWPASAVDRLFVTVGPSLEALSSQGRAWTVALDSPLRFAQFHEDRLLIGTDGTIRRIHPESGAEEWVYRSASPMRGFSLVGGQVCFLASDARGGGTGGVTAVDAERGTASWSRAFEGYSNSPVVDGGELAVLLTTSPSRIHGFEVETGREAISAPLASGGLGQFVLRISDRQLLVAATDRYVEAYEIPSGKFQWRSDLRAMSTRVIEANSSSVLLVGIRGSSTVAAVVDSKSGKVVRLAEGIELEDVRQACLLEDRALIVSRGRDGKEATIRELRLQDLSIGWTSRLGEAGTTLFPPMSAGEHLVVAALDRGENGKFAFSATVLDRAGKSVQNIRSEFKYERPPKLLVAGGALLVAADAGVEIYR